MSKKTSKTSTATPVQPSGNDPSGVWADSLLQSAWLRRCVSVALLVYLAIVLLGPLSNPVGSEFLTRPMADFVSPAHRALFLGHGYRFFGPDPGPGHLVVYRVTDTDGNLIEKRFPDRDQNWPRLLYHRWFMLSETIYAEHSMTPDERSFAETKTELDAQVDALRESGKPRLSKRLARERAKRVQQYQNARERIETLVAAVAEHLMEIHDAKHIELFVQERNIPFAIQVLTGDKLEDEKFLSPLIKIGEFERDENGETISLEQVPTDGESASREVLP